MHAICVARLVPFARRAPLAAAGQSAFLPSSLRPFSRTRHSCTKTTTVAVFAVSLAILCLPSLSLPLSVSAFGSQCLSWLRQRSLSLSLSVMLPDDVDGRVSLFAVIHPCTANSACMNYEMKGGREGGMKAIFRSPADSGRRWSLAPPPATNGVWA